MNVLCVNDCDIIDLKFLLKKYQLNLSLINPKAQIPGSYWGDDEAGIIANTIYVRPCTPIHSLLHESCHYICMDNQRRARIDTDAEGDYDEENGVCYLQILLADYINKVGRYRMMQDMDNWGYTFRLGSAKNWFSNDAEDAFLWLKTYQLIDDAGEVTFALRN